MAGYFSQVLECATDSLWGMKVKNGSEYVANT